MTRTSAIEVNNGDTVVTFHPPARARVVGSAHYHGQIDGTGVVTLCFVNGSQWTGPAATIVGVTS